MKSSANYTKSLLLLFCFSFLVVLFAPKKEKFKYNIVEGKPWQYDLLTAPYNFPILKDAKRLESERDSVRATIKPFYGVRASSEKEALDKWQHDYEEVWKDKLTKAHYVYVRNALSDLYSRGLINEEDLEKLRSMNFKEVYLVDSEKVPRSYPISLLTNVKEAYLTLIENRPEGLEESALKDIDLLKYLTPNVYSDDAMTAEVTKEELKKIPNSTGIVQKGQRIIGKGEIITPDIYNVLISYKKEFESKVGFGVHTFGHLLGTLLIVLGLFVCLWLFWVSFRPAFFKQIKNSVFLMSIVVIYVLLTELLAPLYPDVIYIIPYAILPIIIRPFFRSRVAFFTHIITILASALFVANVMDFILLQLTAGMVTIFSLRTLNSRAQLIRTTFLIFLTYVVMLLAISLMQNGKLESIDLLHLLYLGINLIFLTFSYMLIYPVEKIFGYVSNISLVELGDVNSPLLRELSMKAPGTFQHSMQVSLLASEACVAIGADAQLVRAGALYHDIGKLSAPAYFTENQGDRNPHDDLTEKESAQKIIKHVSDGVLMARKNNLPPVIVDFILTHHGKGKVKYFYTKYCNAHPEEQVDPSLFSYPGPNPFTREQGVLMMADSVEAASRSLKTYSEKTITDLVNKVIDGIMQDGLLNESPLNFRDITTIKDLFIAKLKTIYHSRIEYPKMERPVANTSSPSEVGRNFADNELADRIDPAESEDEQ